MTQKFRTLNIIRDGSGPYHVNRFRVYFKPLKNTTLAALADDFMDNFVVLFNGGRRAPQPTTPTLPPAAPQSPPLRPTPTSPPIAADNTRVDKPHYLPLDWLTLNIAQVSSHHIDNEAMLKFTGDMRIWWGDLNAPDIHDDWVAESWHQNGVGMAMQTQQMLRSAIELSDIFPLALPPPLGPILWQKKHAMQEFNDAHFLAGRRSWVLGEERALQPRPSGQDSAKAMKAATGAVHRYSAEMPTYWYLETAALERYSSVFYRLVQATAPASGAIFPDLKESIRKVWITLLHNFIKWYHIEPEVLTPSPAIWPSPTDLRSSIRFVMRSYDTLDQCLEQTWVKQVLVTHPSLNDQLSELPEIIITAPRKKTTDAANDARGGGGGGGW